MHDVVDSMSFQQFYNHVRRPFALYLQRNDKLFDLKNRYGLDSEELWRWTADDPGEGKRRDIGEIDRKMMEPLLEHLGVIFKRQQSM